MKLTVHLTDLREKPFDPGPGQGGDFQYRGVGDKLDGLTHRLHQLFLTFFIVLDQVPFIDEDDQGSVLILGVADHLGILLGDALFGVDQHHGDIAAPQGLEGLEDGELLQLVGGFALAADAGGIDQQIVVLVATEQGVDGIAGGAGDFGDHHPLLTDDGVDHR